MSFKLSFRDVDSSLLVVSRFKNETTGGIRKRAKDDDVAIKGYVLCRIMDIVGDLSQPNAVTKGDILAIINMVLSDELLDSENE